MKVCLVLVAAALLAGCGGGASSPTPATVAAPASVSDDLACLSHGGVDVSPCHARFTHLFRGPVALTVKFPSGNGTLSETDICGNVATVTGAGSSWSVSAGTGHGHCHALFAYTNSHGKVVGWAHLHIRSSQP